MSLDGHVVQVDPSAVVTVSQSWISIDATGQMTVLDVDKYAIMQRVQIHARDLRILDPNFFYPSAIVSLERVIVLNLEHIKMIITANEVLLRDPSHENVIPVLEELQRRLPVGKEILHHVHENAEAGEEDESTFEFRALEVALEAICIFLAARTTELEAFAYPALDDLTFKRSSRNVRMVGKNKNATTQLTARVQQVRDELEQLLDDDDDMADLYLSRKLTSLSSSISVSDEPHPTSPKIGSKISRASLAKVREDNGNDLEELEMLLEAHFMKVDRTLNKLIVLREYIDDTEDYVNIQLSGKRNQLMLVDLVFRSVHVCVTMYSMIAGIFAMNIPFKWNNDHGYKFELVVSLTGTLCAVLFVIIVSYSRSKGIFDF